MPNVLDQPVESLPGVGKVSAVALAERGYATVGDLVWHLPRRFEDQRTLTPLADLVPGERQLVEGVVAAVRPLGRGRFRRLEVTLEPLPGEEPGRHGCLRLVWFRAPPGMEKSYARGQRRRVAGRVDERRGVLIMAHPEAHEPEAEPPGVVPRYPEIPGIQAKALTRAIAAAVARAAPVLPDTIPEPLRHAEGLEGVGEALTVLHRPPRSLAVAEFAAWNAGRTPHHVRLALEELFLLELALGAVRRSGPGERAAPLHAAPGATAPVESALGFALTAAQRRCVDEIVGDLGRAEPMRRLLQGDVGSGKTAVALLAAAYAVAGGAQVAFLAPTELLAEQQAATFARVAARAGLRLGTLLGSAPAPGRRATLTALARGELDVVVGTHALLGEEVRIPRLGLVVVDEQHRFGVAQRLRLVQKGSREALLPHLLVMTATPIPRSLALSLYGDLHVSCLDALPPGRLPPVTRVYPEARREEALRQLGRALEAGGRAYVVCPSIHGDGGLAGVEPVAAELARRFGEGRVGRMHGELSAEARAAAMRAFQRGEAPILVATTLIEVGVDVPEANVVLVEQAERFGLAQLHQLRGRVGRGGQPSACLLVHGAELGPDAEERLAVMAETHDGFRIAERDLALRGPGQLFGLRQSGASGLAFGDLARDLPLLERARRLADAVLAGDPELEDPAHAPAKRALARMWARDGGGPIREEAG